MSRSYTEQKVLNAVLIGLYFNCFRSIFQANKELKTDKEFMWLSNELKKALERELAGKNIKNSKIIVMKYNQGMNKIVMWCQKKGLHARKMMLMVGELMYSLDTQGEIDIAASGYGDALNHCDAFFAEHIGEIEEKSADKMMKKLLIEMQKQLKTL